MGGKVYSMFLEIGVVVSLMLLRCSDGCQPTEFQCSAGQCIPAHYKCDGEGDCPDSSDERQCEPSRCLPNEFPCHNGRCVPYLYRCDGDNDCGDNSDERCDPFLDNFLIVSETGRDKDLYQIHLSTGTMLPLKIGRTKLNSVAFDETRKVVYWTDLDSGMIRKYPLAGNNRTIETIFTSATEGVLEGMALDLVNNKLYYCMSNATGKSDGLIGVMSLNGANNTVILTEPGQPRSIVLDTTNRLMYWTDWGSTPAIVRARMDDGGARTVLVNSEIKWPNAIAINIQEKVLYWGDAWYHRIESISLVGSSRRQVVLSETATNASYFNFALSTPYLYITDRRQRSVRKLDLQTKQIQNQYPIDVFDRLNGIICYIGNGQDRRTQNSTSTASRITVAAGQTMAATSKTILASQSLTSAATPTASSKIKEPVGTRRAKTMPVTSLLDGRLQSTAATTAAAGAGGMAGALGDEEPVKVPPSISDSTVVTVIVVVVVGVVVMTIVITIGVVVVKAKRARNRLLLEKRLVVAPPADRSINSYNYSPFEGTLLARGVGGGGGGGSTTSCSDDGGEGTSSSSSSPFNRAAANRSSSFKPILSDDALALNNIYSTVVGDYENLNTYEIIDDSFI